MMMSIDDTYAENLIGLNVLPKRIGNGFPTTNPTDTFRCKNGWFSLSIGTDKQWISFARECGRDDWAEDPKYAHDPARSMENYFGDLDQQLNEFLRQLLYKKLMRFAGVQWYRVVHAIQLPNLSKMSKLKVEK